MKLRRRDFLGYLAAPLLRGQGVASRNTQASPRPKPSGLPFLASDFGTLKELLSRNARA